MSNSQYLKIPFQEKRRLLQPIIVVEQSFMTEITPSHDSNTYMIHIFKHFMFIKTVISL